MEQPGKLSQDTQVDPSAVAEWVGLHYRVNFDSQSATQQQEWIERYVDMHSDDADTAMQERQDGKMQEPEAVPTIAVRVADLIGNALDWATAKAEGFEAYPQLGVISVNGGRYQPSQDWNHGGLIIDREKISINYDASGRWSQGWRAFSNTMPIQLAETALVAATRCYVASKLGELVHVPAYLMPRSPELDRDSSPSLGM